MKIDWTKQPEGFPLWLEGTNEEHRKHSGWYRRVGEVFEGAFGGQWRAVREGQFFTVHSKPEPQAWTGVGLPPVSTVCEYRRAHEWQKVEVFAVKPNYNGSHTALFTYENGCWACCAEPSFFRPIRTPEQIAAEEREKAIEDLYFTINWSESRETWPIISKARKADYAKAVDAGYRKQVKP
jgi:hypothetical protein